MKEKEFVEKVMETAIPEVIEALKTQLTYSIEGNVVSTAEEQIVEYVKEWIKENLVPIIGTKLMSIKETMEAQSLELCQNLIGKVFESATQRMEEKLSLP